jgi:hypothetical protein
MYIAFLACKKLCFGVGWDGSGVKWVEGVI